MGFRISKNFLSTFVVLAAVASSAFGGKYVILKPDGTYHDAVKDNGVWKRADDNNDKILVASAKLALSHPDTQILEYDHSGGGWYYPNRGAGSINMLWFTPVYPCSLLALWFYLYSPGDANAYVWSSPFPYVWGTPTSQMYDSVYKYWVYDTTIAHDPSGWVSMPATIVGPVPFSSASTEDGRTGWTQLDLTQFGGPFDIPEGESFWAGFMITDTTFGGRPWVLSGNMSWCVPGRSWQYRTTRFDPPVDYYNFYCYSDDTGEWKYAALVYIHSYYLAPKIKMDSLADTYNRGPYKVTLTIEDEPNQIITRAKIYWNINGGPGAPFDSADLTAVNSIEYTGTIATTASPGDTIFYYFEADDEQPRTGFLPFAGKFAPWNFVVREKVHNNLFVYGDEDCDPVILDVLDTLGVDYDIWDADGDLTGRSYGSPDSSVINAGYNSIVWVTWSGLHFADAADWLMQYFDAGGNLFLSGTDAFAQQKIYFPVPFPEFIHPLLTDYFHFTEITEDFHPGEDTPAWLHGAQGDIISDPFYEDPILFNPAYTYSGQSDWMGKVTHDGSVTDIFFDESNVATGYRYEDPAKGYKYVFLYWNITALSDPGYDDTLGVFDFDAATEIIKRSLLWFGSLVGAEEQGAESMTQAPRLFQNYPNPFRLVTEFRYALSKDSYVKLEIYNISGQKVTSLVNENQKAGYQTICWDGLDYSGKRVAPGVYFYKLKAGDYSKTRKMALLK